MCAEPRKKGPIVGLPAKMSREEEIQLAELAANGDRPAQRRIVQMLLAGVRNIVVYAVNDAAWAEDISQSAMIKVLLSLKDYRGESSLGFWSTRIAIRMAMKAIKKRRRRQQLMFYVPDARSPFQETDVAAQAGELRQHINHVVSKLSERQQVAIRLRFVHDYSIKEIAELTDTSENTVRDRLRVGKKRFRKLLDKNPELVGWIRRGTS